MFPPQDRIEEVRLVRLPDRLGVVEAGQGSDPGTWDLADFGDPRKRFSSRSPRFEPSAIKT